jgi:predicted house-cleaning noncanonical NTP pyrophosphatase (MazG superfamily)
MHGIAVSLALHGLLLLIFTLPPHHKRQSPPLQESLAVEIWTPEQVQALINPPKPEIIRQNLPQSGTIRATRILSGEALAHPRSRKMRETLPRFDEETRLEQLCNLEAMAQIAASLRQFQPDRVVAYARSEVTIADNIIVAEGAAFRSHQRWHGLTFKCGISPDRQAVLSFEFSVGEAIPKRLWEKYNLPDPMMDTE